MWGNIAPLLIALPVAAALQLLIPRHFSRAWAIWLLICLMVASVQWIGQAAYDYYNPDDLYRFTKQNQLAFHQQFVTIAGTSLILGFVVLLLLLRAEPEVASSRIAMISARRGLGISLQLFGLATLAASMATAIVNRRSEVNVLGVVVIASGYYVTRGSRLAGKWAVAFMALLTVACLLFVSFIAFGENVEPIGPREAPWAIIIGLLVTAWAVINLLLAVRFLRKTTEAAEQVTSAVRPSD